MRTACLFFPHFAVQVEVRDNPSLVGKPIIVGGLPHERKSVHDASDEAVAYGIRPGMPLRQAHSLCPEGVFLPLRESEYSFAFEVILDLLTSYSPIVENHDLGCAFLDADYIPDETQWATGLREAIQEQTGLTACASVASNKFVAWVAARTTRLNKPAMVPHGEEEDFLEDLPVDFLPISGEILRRLKLLGLRKIGQVKEIPLDSALMQFGAEGRRLWELAKGIDPSELIPWQRPEVLEEKISLEMPAESFDQVLLGSERLLGKLSLRLGQRWQCCQSLAVTLEFANDSSEQTTLRLKEPTSDRETMLRRLGSWLETVDLGSPVTELSLSACDLCAERGQQRGLVEDHPKFRSNLPMAIGQLQSRYGDGVIERAVVSGSASSLPEKAFSMVAFT